MNPSNVNSSPSRPSEGRSRAAIWGLPLIAGVLLFIGGALCLVASGSTGMATMGVFGTVLFVAGIIEITRATRERSEHAPFMPHFLSGVLSLVVGGLFLVHPASGLVAVTLLLAGYFFCSGIFRAVTSVMDRYEGWGWDCASGIGSLVLGALVIANWPLSSVYLVGVLVAVELMMRGLAIVAMALVVRRILPTATA